MSDIAIIHGKVVPITGPDIDNGTVLISDGKIVAVGTDITIPDNTTIIDARGQWVLPGLVEAHGHIGIQEEANGPAGNDTNEMTRPTTPGVRAIDAVNIEDEGFRDALAGGVTAAVIKPGSGNVIGGLSVALKTWGGRTIDEQVIAPEVSVKSALGENPKRVYGGKDKMPSTRLGVAFVLREAFVKAQNYRAKRDAAAMKDEPFDRDLDLEVLVRVLEGELVWDQHTHRHDDIVTAIRLAEEFGYRLVVNHGTEGGKIADVLAEKDIPVIFGPIITSRSKVELRDRSVRQFADMAAAGVRLAITTDHPVVPINLLITQGSMAVREGAPRQTVLEAMTINPARFLGLDDRIGSLEPGKDADVVVWSGDPLDVHQRVEHVVIDGDLVYTWNEDTHSAIIAERSERF
ncbi:amidohydrolase [Jonesia denitrificans]|uniref:Amidohydrolase n=1 Tax=Jonesia denitrificans (strain ATCC 14870 / DSM 20603 / BCRC 15368 / CIP 55.134 / JCM 11481 / NBRC 15587 / NCTC 10816 / Prevot 55134) TaxID=471856 RepID=C7QYQ2_JONDD|nr:amidohydrolase [Jonesia denitrificans]ACV07899.1 amidohydrolase [Jonesia denitrificans DSM 20603]ASE08400.1 amidohydrolase [Jonesia denitrificans]QXB43001.1 amidohydrolase [Jonesia denitrificans]SQH19872.1 Cytosine deaminase and related metal-dependent hydrolases [Jonesia denitrificans]